MVYRIFSLLVLLQTLIFANEQEQEVFPVSSHEQIAGKFLSDDYIIGKVVSPIGGSPCLSQTDLLANGAQKISINRYYNPVSVPSSFHQGKKREQYELYQYLSQNYIGWNIYPHLRLKIQERNGPLLILLMSRP